MKIVKTWQTNGVQMIMYEEENGYKNAVPLYIFNHLKKLKSKKTNKQHENNTQKNKIHGI